MAEADERPAPGTVGRLDRDGLRIAYRWLDGDGPAVVFLPGYASNMSGTKAVRLAHWCAARGRAFLSCDYRGHGDSGGRFEDGTLGEWIADARAVIETVTAGRLVLVGSSMGGWIMLRLAMAMPERVAALVGVAAAPDFTVDYAERRLDAAERATLARDGIVWRPSRYGDALPITSRFLAEASSHLLPAGEIPVRVPVRLLHGMRDPDVPWQVSLDLAGRLAGDDVELCLVKDGEHRMSRPADLARLEGLIESL
ncbi:MAG: alpha/beta hydrolase [Ectothiorhodospiraceae bacterium]|nr:alpha/beta hydrolase [Chromatiales bacterium]MCP5153516.1 alpha/beta hydrolase [Ectothiorhodospiraceae bacterium]